MCAIAHEVGNLLSAVRLQTHLLDEDLGPRELAVASVEIDALCARTGTWLAHVRPLLQEVATAVDVSPAVLLSSLQRTLEEQGGRGATLSVKAPAELPAVRVDPAVMHSLLLTLVYGAADAARPRGNVRVSAVAERECVVFRVEDDSSADEALENWEKAACRGRPLACAVADHIARKLGGWLAVARENGCTRVALGLPTRAAR